MTLELPLPPSVNRAFVSRKGSHMTAKSAAYKFWLRTVMDEVVASGLPPCLPRGERYGMWIDMPAGRKGDIDNRVKLLSDVLREHEGLGVVVDDELMWCLCVGKIAGLHRERCYVTVAVIDAWPGYVDLRLGT